jgi:glyoxalase family protein
MDITFFEYPDAARGRAGAGMVHRIVWRVDSAQALEFWKERLDAHGVSAALESGSLRFEDPEGLGHEFRAVETSDRPLGVAAPQIPAEHALQGFDGVHAFSADPARSRSLLADTLGFTPIAREGGWEVRGPGRGSFYAYDPPPPEPGRQGAGSVHHVAFAAQPQDEEAWQERVAASGAHATPVIERFYFRSVYFREPSGVLFEIATIGPGFAVDEEPEHLGEHLSLPPRLEPLRAQLERTLKPLPYPRVGAPAGAPSASA